MSRKASPLLAVSIGCPSGIGPEVSVVAAMEASVPVLLVGNLAIVKRAARGRGIDEARIVALADAKAARKLPPGVLGVWDPGAPLRIGDAPLGKPTSAGGAAQLAWIDAACDLVAAGEASALVTGPASKEAIVRSGAPGSRHFLGHTEHLQRRLRAEEVVMAFWAKPLSTALVTTHLPLAKVPRAITPEAVARATFWLGHLLAALREDRKKVVLAVCGLNPHAGEGGLLGTEETTRIAPGIEAARKRLAAAKLPVDVRGPLPAESALRLAVGGAFAGVVAMYHDQATIPMKLVGFGEAVNVSLGLPIVRTSVDHGTAYDRASGFSADARGMAEALALAARIAPAPARAVTARTPASRRTRGART